MRCSDTPGSILLISSRADPAGSLIHDEVQKILSERPEIADRYQHRRYEERLIYLSGSDLTTDAECIIFLSRHASQQPRPVLTVHVTGNFGKADYGGNSGTLTPAATRMMHWIMNQLAREVPEGYAVTYEATHHGPTQIPVPSCFVEVGSTEVEWHDSIAAAAVARSVIYADPLDTIPLAGFGGTHYAKRQTEITLTTRGGFGHIIPTRDLVYLNHSLFTAIITSSDAQAIYIDRKAVTRDDIRKIEQYALEDGIPVVGQSDLTGLKSLSFKDYIRILKLADSLIPGSSVTLHALKDADDPVPVRLSPGLIAETIKTAPEEFAAGLDTLPVAHLSGQGVAYHATFITKRENTSHISDDLINLCVSILQRNSDCEADGDFLIIGQMRLDPVKAQALGVPPGPAYGSLMAGRPIRVGSNEVTPDMVMVRSEKRISIRDGGYDEVNR
ncbi:MAG TPA: D-aminoacyl-tRNA deacylase [Methanospirillum sp.]|nr:D-aminoacyl-tRNA deacylase [Methanospirillum sp.]